MKRIATSVILLGASLSWGSAAAQNLLTNPSFETGDLAGWTKTGGGFVRAADSVVAARTGMYAFDTSLVSGMSAPTLGQAVAVTGGTAYEAGLYMAINPTGPGSGTISLTTGMGIEFSETTASLPQILYSLQSDSPARYQRVRNLVWVPDGQTSATIRFAGSGLNISSFVFSNDDYYLTPWTPTGAAAAAAQVLGADVSIGGRALNVRTAPALAAAGRIGAIDTSLAGQARIVARAGDGTYSELVNAGSPAPGGGTFLRFNAVSLSPGGSTVAFDAELATTFNRVIATVDSDGVVREHARNVGFINDYRVDDSGRVVFSSESGLNGPRSVFRSDGSGPEAILVAGAANAQGVVQTTGRFSQNNAGSVAVEASVRPDGQTTNRTFIYVHDGTTASVRVGEGDAAPGTSATFTRVDSPVINDAGAVAFRGRTNITSPFQTGIWVNDAESTTHDLAIFNQAAPGGGNFIDFGLPVIGDGGHVAFAAKTGSGSGIFRARTGEAPVAIVLAGETAPDGNTFDRFDTLSGGFMASTPLEAKVLGGGQVAFLARHDSTLEEMGIYLGDGQEIISVAKWGETIDAGGGSTIRRLSLTQPVAFGTTLTPLPDLAVNDFGQVAYTATLVDGEVKTFLYTPALRWRARESGNWSDSVNWTVGLSPADVHPVVIDSPHAVTVTAPAGQTKVKSLEITAGNTLVLVGSDLTVTDGLTIAGRLAGQGTIDGDLSTVGVLELALLDDRFDITGTLDLGGDIYVHGIGDVGETFDLITAGDITGTATWHLPGGSTFQVVDLPGGGMVVRVTYVPEPTGVVLFAVVAVLARRRRG